MGRSPEPEKTPVSHPQELSWINAFLLSNLLALIYILGQVCTKQVLISQDSMSTFELAFFRSAYNLTASSIYLSLSEAKLKQALDQ